MNETKTLRDKFMISPHLLILLAALFITLTANHTFFSKVLAVYPWSENAGFLLSLGVLLFCIITVLSFMLNWLMPIRLALSILFLTAASAGYFTDQFGTVFDIEMIRSMVETDSAEAVDLLSWGLVLRVILTGIIPVMLVWWIPIDKQPKWAHRLSRAKRSALTLVAIFILMAVSLFSASGQYASFFRQHKVLRYYANPLHPLYSVIKFGGQQFSSTAEHDFIAMASYASVPKADFHRELVIVVVGETARADHFSLNGYKRQTNPLLEQEQRLVSYSNISSCGTSTAISVPCMFSLSGRKDFEVGESEYTQNVLDIVAKAGISVLWRDNNSSSKGVADRVAYESFKTADNNPVCDPECRDVGMLSGLQEYIDGQQNDILIVLHQMGSHGPAYGERYPSAFEKFTPACHTSELANCSDEEIINAYDNSILYTDYFLTEVIALLKRNTPGYETSMLYISDHGESLGENNLYLHGMPYTFAPQEQTHVPIIAWIGETSDIDLAATRTLKDQANSHDAVSGAILQAMEVNSDLPQFAAPPLFIMKEEH
ncbi:MAG: lipid A ethanolaminephosphotransferase [Paraglaciecola sp.]|jgi:lipid A ethanolaminephosphotransferase